MEATQVKNDELQLCYDLKRESAQKIEELQKIINKLTDIPKSQIKAKRDVRNVLCDKCRGRPYEILNLPLRSFAQIGCQTDGQLSDQELSQISKTETYDDKNGSAKQNISVLSLPTRGQGEEEQDTVKSRKETTLSEQIKRLRDEKKELQRSLKSKQEIIQKHEAVLESKNEEHQTALTKLKAALSKTFERLTLENEELKNNMKTQQETVQKLRTMLAMKAEGTVDTYHQQQRKIQNDSSDTKMDESPDREAGDADLESYKREKVQADSQIQRLEREQQILQSDLNECNTKMAQTESKMKRLQAENDKLKENKKTLDEELEKLKSGKRNLDSQIQRLNQVKQSLQTEVADLDARVSRTESELLTTRRENKKLTDSQKARDDELESYKHEKVQAVLQIQRLERDQQSLQSDLNERNTKMAEKESEMKKMQAENNKLKESRKEKIDEGHKERERYEKEISQVQVEKQSLEEQKDSLNRTIEDLSSALKAEQKKTNKLAGHLEENRSELDKIKEENKMYVVKISQLETEKQTLQDQIDTLNKTNEEMVPNMEDQHHEMEKLKRKLDEKDEKSLMEDCRRLKKKEVVMRVLRASRSGVGKTMMKTVTDVLARQLRRRLDSRHFDFTIDFPDILADVSKGPLFLVCLNSTVGKNVPDALEGPKGGRDVYLLVLHQITTENLSTLRPDSLRNTGSELRQLGGVIDMVFSSESGFSSESCLWECDINSTAVEKIVTVLKKI